MIETHTIGGLEMRPNIGRTILGGFFGTLAITLLMYKGAPMMGLPKMDIAAMLGRILGGWTPGMIMHFANGAVIFPLIYAYLLFSKLPGAPAVKGITLGVALWVMAQVIVMPMMGAGMFGLKTGGGVMSAFGSLIGHVIYGALLGWIGGHAHHERIEHPAIA
jgi:uncharacterized membrane protein YagU involved in acid resistance